MTYPLVWQSNFLVAQYRTLATGCPPSPVCTRMLHQLPPPAHVASTATAVGHHFMSSGPACGFPFTNPSDFFQNVDPTFGYGGPCYPFAPQQNFDMTTGAFKPLENTVDGVGVKTPMASSYASMTPQPCHPKEPTPPKKSFRSPEDEQRHDERRKRNNKAAQVSRLKRKEREETLKAEVDRLKAENKRLQRIIDEFQRAEGNKENWLS